jgi:hypothetical protein
LRHRADCEDSDGLEDAHAALTSSQIARKIGQAARASPGVIEYSMGMGDWTVYALILLHGDSQAQFTESATRLRDQVVRPSSVTGLRARGVSGLNEPPTIEHRMPPGQ